MKRYQQSFLFSKTIIAYVLVCLLTACAPTPNIMVPSTQPPPKKLIANPRVVLVLGSGGARGYAHIGVLNALENAGIPIDMVVGASAGSVMGAIYADRGNVNELRHVMLHTTMGDFIDGAFTPSLKGPLTTVEFQDFLLAHMHARTFSQLKIPLVIATTDLKTGETYVIDSGPVAPAVTASAAIPGLVEPMNLYGRTLVDGGVADPVPVDIAKRYHPKVIIAVDLRSDLPAEMPSTAYGIFYRAYSISWNNLDKLSTQGADIVIHPQVGDTSMFAVSEKRKMYRAGVAAADQALPQILKLLAAQHISLNPKAG